MRSETSQEHIDALRARIRDLQADLNRVRVDSPYFTRAEAAAFYRVCPKTIDRLIAAGKVRKGRIGRVVLVRRDELAKEIGL